MAQQERRGNSRRKAEYPVEVRLSTGREFKGIVENLGALGALVTTPDLDAGLAPGERVTLKVDVPDREPLVVAGEVLRVEQELVEGDVRRSFAVRFDAPITL